MVVVVFLVGIVVGFLIAKLIDSIEKARQNELVRQVFYDVLTTAKSGGCRFESRVNDHVMVHLVKGIYMGHLITINLVERGLSISMNNKVLYVSDFITMNFPKDTVVDDIIKEIERRFGKKMNDTVVVNGIKIDRDFLDKTLKETGQSMGENFMDGGIYDEKLAPKEEEILPSVDDILDKISASGLKSLTEQEKEILYRQSKDGGED